MSATKGYFTVAVIVAVGGLVVAARARWEEPKGEALLVVSAESACTDRGISYFRQIGSYPTLTDGRSASLVARERCSSNPDQFAGISTKTPFDECVSRGLELYKSRDEYPRLKDGSDAWKLARGMCTDSVTSF